MGLRFRKSVTIAPGVKLNFGKTGASISVGTKGLHANLHTSGKLTGTASLPGTGISYVKSTNVKKTAKNLKESREKKKAEKAEAKAAEEAAAAAEAEALAAEQAEAAALAAAAAAKTEEVPAAEEAPVGDAPVEERPADAEETGEAPVFHPAQLTDDALRGIHKSFDEPVDWLEFAGSETPPDAGFDPDIWAYYHAKAPAILEGDIDAYLEVIYEVAPLDDLLDYGGQFQFGTDRASLMEVEFAVNEETLETQRREKNVIQFYDLLQDYVCSTCIRAARDIFSLLPVADVVVHAVLAGDTVVSVRFDRETMDKIKFGFVDPSDVMERFQHSMDFQAGRGFAAVERIDTSL